MALLREILVMTDRTIWLLDTFEGFPDGQEDRLLGTDTPVRSVQFANFRTDVEENFLHCHLPCRNLRFVEGPVEETLPTLDIRIIALLRLDTDFYASTRAELSTCTASWYAAECSSSTITAYSEVQGGQRTSSWRDCPRRPCSTESTAASGPA
jgi:hypothetical protein